MLKADAQDQRCRALIAHWRATGDHRALHSLWSELGAYAHTCNARLAHRGMGVGLTEYDAPHGRGAESGELYAIMVAAVGKFDPNRPAWFRSFLALEIRTAGTNRAKVVRGRLRHWERDADPDVLLDRVRPDRRDAVVAVIMDRDGCSEIEAQEWCCEAFAGVLERLEADGVSECCLQ